MRKVNRGQSRLFRFADDFVCCFDYRHEAETFSQAVKERLAKFGLELALDKTQTLRFSRQGGESLSDYRTLTLRALYYWLNRRSQRRSQTWQSFNRLLKRFGVPLPRIQDKARSQGLRNKPGWTAEQVAGTTCSVLIMRRVVRERAVVKSPVRENRPPGSVRGAPGNRRSYRNPANDACPTKGSSF